MTSMWISPAMLERLAGSLLHFVWQGAAIAVVAALALRLLRGRPAEWRYATASGGLCAMLAAPFITFLFYAETGALTLWVLSRLNSAAAAASEASAVGIEVWTQRIVFIWVVGVVVLLARLAGGWLLSRRMLRWAVATVTRVVVEALGRARAGVNFDRKVRLLSGEHIETPVVVGWLRPAILLPASALTGLSADHLLAILAHELAHIRRHDFFVNGVQRAVECVLFYHPAVWWISGRMRVERELCCDDLAVRVCGDRMVYVRALVALENARAVTPMFAQATAGAGVADRVRRILGRGANRDWQSAVAALVFAAILVSAGMWQPTFAGPVASALPPQIQQPSVQQTRAQAPPPSAPLNSLLAIATAEGVRAAERAGGAEPPLAQKVTQPTIAASREAARDKLGMLRVEYSAESFVKQAAEGDTIAIKTFLAAGMNINARNENGYTALMKAASSGQTETVQALLAAGADSDLANGGRSALSLAAVNGDLSTMKVLIAGGAQVDLKLNGLPYQPDETALILAAVSGKRESVTLLLDSKASIDAKSDRWGTALVAAACQKHFDTARALLDRGANPNASSAVNVSSGSTALHCAAMHGSRELIQLLLDKGADINAKMSGGQTPLIASLTSGRVPSISTLTPVGVNSPGNPGVPAPPPGRVNTPGNPSAFLLIDRGADVNASADNGMTALSLAVELMQSDIVRALLAKGADPNKKGRSGNPLLLHHLVNGEGGVEMAILLINGGADVNAALENGATPLLFAAQAKQIDIVRALLAKGADPNRATKSGATPLRVAAEAPEIRQLL